VVFALLQLTNPARTNPPLPPGGDISATNPPPPQIAALLHAAPAPTAADTVFAVADRAKTRRWVTIGVIAGWALANEFSDHVTERINYLYLAHSKLRPASFGPEILLGELPADIRGHSRIYRDGAMIWEKPFLSGEANMSHSYANLEHHHFKYDVFCQAGDVHVHMFGTATLSFADGIVPKAGDIFEIDAPVLGMALRNPLQFAQDAGLISVKTL
jgi:hypothetical protein